MEALTDLNPEATVVSIDGIGACDLISRNVVLEGLLQMENGDQVLPFVRNLYWHWLAYVRREGETRWAPYTTEGGGAGNALMLLLLRFVATPCFRSQARL